VVEELRSRQELPHLADAVLVVDARNVLPACSRSASSWSGTPR
jgi:hypothetical protein